MIVGLEPRWRPYIDDEWIDRLDRTELLTRCREGVVTRPELLRFVGQQFHYARHFTRYLCALLSNVVDEGDRRALTENLFGEMGLGGASTLTHAQLYRETMAKMGLVPGAESAHPATERLVETMLSACRSPRHMIGLGALCCGAEAIVPHVYSTVLAGFEAVGEPERHLVFFRIHVEADDEHAVTMGRIIERELARDPSLAADLRCGARQALAARVDFFEEIVCAPSLRAA